MKPMGNELAQSLPKPSQDAEAQGHLDTLDQAAKIMQDPAKLAKVHSLAGRRHKAVMGLMTPKMKKFKSIQSLKDHANSMAKGGAAEDHEPDAYDANESQEVE